MATKKQTSSETVTLVDPSNVAEVFATDVALVHYEGTTVIMTFATTRVHQESEDAPLIKAKVVTARIAMPLTAAVNLHNLLGQVIETYRKRRQSERSAGAPPLITPSKPN
jgi:hypothetical protein